MGIGSVDDYLSEGRLLWLVVVEGDLVMLFSGGREGYPGGGEGALVCGEGEGGGGRRISIDGRLGLSELVLLEL